MIDAHDLRMRPAYLQMERIFCPSDSASPSFGFLLGTVRNSSAQEDAALKLIAQFRDATDPKLRKIIAMQISNDYTARMLLKNRFKDLGREYFTVWFNEGDGLAHEMIRRARAKLTGYPTDVLNRIKIIQNLRSLAEMSAPMDLDAGVFVETGEESRNVLKQLGGPKGARQFEEAFEEALKEAYSEIYGGLGGPGRLNPERAFITGTTPWHPEAYVDARVLREGGVAGRDLIQLKQQT